MKSKKQYLTLRTMLRQQRTGCEEEDNDDLLESILRYNKDMLDDGVVVATTPSSYDYQKI